MTQVSLKALQGMFAEQTDEVFLLCLTVDHPTLTTPLLFVNNAVDLVRTAGTFIAFPFQINLPDQTDQQMPQVTLVIDNVDRSIGQQVRTLTSPPTITLEVVLASTPDTVEAGPFVFTAFSAQYDATTVSFTLSYEAIMDDPANKWTLTPAIAPGAF